MNDVSSFQEIWSYTLRTPSSCFLHEQRHQYGTSFRLLLHTHNLIALTTGICTKREKIPGTVTESKVEYAKVRFPRNTPYAQRRAIMKWRWLAVVGLSFALSACETFNPCSSPSVIGPAPCYYYLTIVDKNPNSGELRGIVAQSVVKEDASKLFSFYTEEEYQNSTYKFRVQESELASLNMGDSYMFVSEINQSDLKLCTTDECNKAAEHFSQSKEH